MSCNCNDYLGALPEKSTTYQEYEDTPEKLTWCSGCGNYSIEKALMRALTLEGVTNRDILMCYDIGCSGNESDKIGAYTIHGLHGRVLPLAAGAVIANNKLKVIATSGDGASFSEGVNHLVHAVRNDYPILFVFHNNENYGLTTGQASAATRKGQKMNGSPDGVFVDPVNACQFVLSLHPTFVARAFSGDTKHTTEIIREGLKHKGFAFVEIMQTCPTYNKATSQNWFWDRIHYLSEDPSYNPHDIWLARKTADDLEEKIALGVLYKRDEPHFLERIPHRQGKESVLTDEVQPYDISKLLEEFK
jgi:2-oxoglutarate ferredoxin oxidoreductase subunit beta